MLLNVFVALSQPSFLLANETNHVLLFSLLDAMNAILEHQFEGTCCRESVYNLPYEWGSFVLLSRRRPLSMALVG